MRLVVDSDFYDRNPYITDPPSLDQINIQKFGAAPYKFATYNWNPYITDPPSPGKFNIQKFGAALDKFVAYNWNP